MRTRRNKSWLAALAAMLALVTVTARAGETITYIHWDALGSPVAATDEGGNVIWRESYRPYGARIDNEAGAATNSRWYTGHPQDGDTGLVYAGARYYDPTIGRFLGVDPAGVQEGKPGSFNRYAYGNNNPYRYVDPDGKNGTEAIGGLFYESGQFLMGHGFDGVRVWGALLDGYNGEGGSVVHAAFQDAMTAASVTAIGGVAARAYQLARVSKIGDAAAEAIGKWGNGSLDDLLDAANGTRRSKDIVVEGGRQRAKDLFRGFDTKGLGNRIKLKDKTGGGRAVAGELGDGTPLRIRFKRHGSTRIQAGPEKMIFPE